MFLLCILILVSCKNDNVPVKVVTPDYFQVRGKTMGTTYSVIMDSDLISKAIIDSLLVDINLSVSTYIPESTISRFNNDSIYGTTVEVIRNGKFASQHKVVLDNDEHFLTNYNKAKEIYMQTDGYFDPTVMPLVNYWGFGITEKKAITVADSMRITALQERVGLDRISFSGGKEDMTFVKPSGTQLDFSAIAKGYAVDYIAKHLSDNGLTNYMVEIGGEVYAQGSNPRGVTWTLGINTPNEMAALNDFSAKVSIDSVGLASSGNYRNYHIHNGVKYGHEINPNTGYPEKNNLLGVSVIAPSCMEADAVATALMIMGLDKGMKYINDYLQLEAAFFYGNNEGGISQVNSSGMGRYLKAVQNREVQ